MTTSPIPLWRIILKRLRQVMIAIAALYIGLAIIGAIIYFLINPNNSSIELSKVLFELSLWLSIPIAILMLVLKAWRLLFVSLLIVGIFAVLYLPYFIPRDPPITSNGQQLRVMTFNTLATSEGLVDAIQSANADIVALQELSKEGSATLSQLSDIYPYQALHPQDDPVVGQGILSRYPIESDDYWEYPSLPHTLGHQRIEINMDGIPIIVYNTHPWPPLGWESGYNDESHRVVVNHIAKRTFDEELPLILVGDFNMTSVFEEYELLNSRFTDSFRAAGDGIGYTYPNDKYRPLSRILRLDYIWHSDDFQSIESTVWEEHGQSDHSPVVSTLLMTTD